MKPHIKVAIRIVYELMPPQSFDISKVVDLEVDGISMADYPDFCDAYFCDGYYKVPWGYRPLTESELDYLTEEHGDLLHEAAYSRLF